MWAGLLPAAPIRKVFLWISHVGLCDLGEADQMPALGQVSDQVTHYWLMPEYRCWRHGQIEVGGTILSRVPRSSVASILGMTKFRLVRRKRYSAFWFSWEFGSDFSIHPTYQKLQTLNVKGDIDTLNSLIFIGVKWFLCSKRNQWSLFWCSKFSSSHSNNSRNYCCIVFSNLWKSLKPVEISGWRCSYETF